MFNTVNSQMKMIFQDISNEMRLLLLLLLLLLLFEF